MTVNAVPKRTSNAPIQNPPPIPETGGGGQTAAEWVVEKYKVEASSEAVHAAIDFIERCMGKIQADKNRLTTGGDALTASDLKNIKNEMAALEARIEDVRRGIGEAMDALASQSKGFFALGNGTGVRVELKGTSWEIRGLKPNVEFMSQLPVLPTIQSVRMHKALLGQYTDNLAAAEADLQQFRGRKHPDDRQPPGTFETQLVEHIQWWKKEIGDTQLSIAQARSLMTPSTTQRREEALERHRTAKTAYDTLCLELSTIKDNGIHNAQARADVLNKEIDTLEASMKANTAIIAEADEILAA